MKTRIAIALFVTLTANAWAADKNRPSLVDLPLPVRWLTLDEDGWTTVKPSVDSRLIYVSSSEGSDEKAQVYKPGDGAIGNDPLKPVGAVQPYKTIAKAVAQARDKMPDWVLLKRGDQWRDLSLVARNGRSESEPFVIGAYGTASARPLIAGRTARMSVGGPNSGVSHSVVMSLDLYCSFIDPASPDYGVDERTHDRERNKTRAGMQISTGRRAPMENVLVEDCRFRFCGLNTQNFGGVMRNVVFRRNVVLDRYPVHGHTMGMWGAYATILVEECIFDHNGWLLQNVAKNKGRRGLAIPLSHNTYCTGMNSTIFRGNTFLRAASIGNKWTANQGPGSARNIVIANNLFLHQRSADVRNVYAIHVGSSDAKGTYKGKGVHCRNVTIRDNVIHGLESSGPMVRIGGGELFENVVFAKNKVQLPGLQQPLMQIGSLAGVKFEGNTYFSEGEAGSLFTIGGRADRQELGFNDWLEKSGETGARFEKTPFPDPDRSIERYMQSLGKAPTHAAFMAAMRKQSKANWRPELTASVINDWFRAGFAAKKVME